MAKLSMCNCLLIDMLASARESSLLVSPAPASMLFKCILLLNVCTHYYLLLRPHADRELTTK